MKRLALLGLALVLIAPASAFATLKMFDGAMRPLPARYHEWLADAKVPTPRGLLFVFRQECPYYDRGTVEGCAASGAIYVSPRLRGFDERHVFLHELGHVFDFRHLSDQERVGFQSLIGVRGAWCGSTWSACEWLADMYATCARDLTRYPRVCRFIRRSY